MAAPLLVCPCGCVASGDQRIYCDTHRPGRRCVRCGHLIAPPRPRGRNALLCVGCGRLTADA